jgi:hypothetical protein
MPDINDAARQTLKKLFSEVSDRANRLSEWLAYQEKLRPLQNSFGNVIREVESGVDLGAGFRDGALVRIKQAWLTCRASDLLEIQIFNENVILIDKPLNNGTAPAAKVKYNVSEFFDFRKLIDEDLGKAAAIDLRQHCSDLDDAIRRQSAVLRSSVQSEMQELCDLTRQLYKDFVRD